VTQVLESALDDFRGRFTGQVIMQADSAYDAARVVWNAEIDHHPAMIVRCLNATDVSAAVIFARQQGLEISVRGGAHNMSGSAVGDDGLMIDLSQLCEVTVDPAGRRAQVGGGALLADMDAATQAHGLATPSGLVSHTGVGGLTLGGGMGWLTRKFGMAIDNLIAAEIVVADGRILRAAADENPELFWAIRGGGGNFGVVTGFEFQLHKVGPLIEFGLFFWGLDQGTEVLRTARDVIGTLPGDVNAVIAGLNAPPAPFVPEQHHFRPGYALLLTGFGSADEHAAVTARIRETLPPLFELVTPMPYVELQQLLDEANAWGMFGYEKSCYVEGLPDDAIAVITDQLPRKSSPLSNLLFYRLDGAYSEVADDETSFSGGRSPRYAIFIVALAATRELLAADRRWVRSFWEALRPYALGIGSYVNGMAEFEEDRVRAAYGAAKYQRLAQVKADYDSENVFHHNANIKPALAPGSTTG
jgi:FAD binding domain/Berberine and berberine like